MSQTDKIIDIVSKLIIQFYYTDENNKEDNIKIHNIKKKATSYAIEFCQQKQLLLSSGTDERFLINELNDKFKSGYFENEWGT